MFSETNLRVIHADFLPRGAIIDSEYYSFVLNAPRNDIFGVGVETG